MPSSRSHRIPLISEIFSFFRQCPLCAKTYDEKELTVIAMRGEEASVHIRCQACSAAYLVFVSQTYGGGTHAVAAVTDLTSEDARTLYNSKQFDENDLFSGYRVIHSNTFSSHFNKWF